MMTHQTQHQQQQGQKPYECFTCKKEIRLQRNPDNSGWLKFNPDGTEHIHIRKQQQRYFVAEEKQSTNLYENRLVNIEKTLTALKTDVRSLIMQMQLLRQEIGEKNRHD
jgi:hypothetical protein